MSPRTNNNDNKRVSTDLLIGKQGRDPHMYVLSAFVLLCVCVCVWEGECVIESGCVQCSSIVCVNSGCVYMLCERHLQVMLRG